MDRSVSQTARILGVKTPQVKTWTRQFKEQLSQKANPSKGTSRVFTDSDILALAYVAMHWEEGPDIEAMQIGLNRQDHYEDEYQKFLYQATPIL